jgi:flagellin-specific chaperone FliS
MPLPDPPEVYRKMSAVSAGKLKSVLLLMDRAVLLLKEARADPALLSGHAVKIQNILAQLEQAINFREGPQSRELFALFDYLFQEIGRRDGQAVETALVFLTKLRGALSKDR